MSKMLVLLIAAALALGTSGEAFAAPKKQKPKRADAPLVQRDYDGTPIIMKGYRPSGTISIMKDEPGTGRVSDPPSKKADRPRTYPRGSSGAYIPPPVPSPRASSLPAPALVQPAPQVYQPPKINSFGDRATNAIHDFPLQRGIGNNPNDLQSFIRQRANQ
jgi:hypothetical protein